VFKENMDESVSHKVVGGGEKAFTKTMDRDTLAVSQNNHQQRVN
jgi:hypothetical protein